jgi:TolB-like protein/DNA-binding SARP family transcriptional activator
MAVAELTLFGGFELRRAGGEDIDLSGQKERALLAVLALRPGASQSRNKLAGLLWGDRGDKQARDSLKHSVIRLRQSLASIIPPPVVSDRESVRLDPAALAIDVGLFEQLLKDGTLEALERAAALYRGDLLEGFTIRDASFEDWLAVERRRLRQSAEEALAKVMAQSMSAGARDRAAAAAQRLLLLDPLREAACRTLMQIEAERAQTAQALKLYEVLRERLHRELGVKPEPATTQLYESIRLRRAGTAPSTGLSPAEPGPRAQPMPAELPLPSKPSIAVLPFQNLSGDPEQEYFADGMVEDIITAISRMRWLFVIARASSFTYKGRAVDPRQVARELCVRYVLEGSVRKAASRVRIAGQLIDGLTGAHLWADRFEGALEDIFDLQDQVTASVVGAIAPRLEQAEIERAKRKPTESLDAYDHYLRGLASFYRFTKEGTSEALRMFYRAVECDPDFASGYGMAARCYFMRKVNGWMTDRVREIAETARLARRAVASGRDDAEALAAGGGALAYVVGDLDDGAAFIDRALGLNPNLAVAWLFSGWARIWLGEPDTAIEKLTRTMRLSPLDPRMVEMQTATAYAHFFAGRYEEASSWVGMALRDRPDSVTALWIAAASNALAGWPEQAQKALARLQQLQPALRVSNLRDHLGPYRRPEDVARYEEGMRKAGLPE